jgi:hypothetical protein
MILAAFAGEESGDVPHGVERGYPMSGPCGAHRYRFPISFRRVPLTRRLFTFYAWLTMASAFVAVPLTYLAFILEGRSDAVGNLMHAGLQVIGSLLYLAVTVILKRFLNRLLLFHDTDKNIDLMILAEVVAGTGILVGIFFPELREGASLVAVGLMVAQGVVQIQFGFRLLTLRNTLGGLLKPFCYLNMATGLCMASIVLALPGVVLSAVSDLMLATIYFMIVKELKEAEVSRQETK